MIQYYSFKEFPKDIRASWIESTNSVISSGIYISGDYVRKFEDEFKSYLGIKHAIGVGNGFDGLVAALNALELDKGSLIAVPAHTFIACWNAITAAGHIPLGVDVDSSGIIDLKLLNSLPKEVRAIMVVHMHGIPVDMYEINKWAKARNAYVIEDCSQAHGALFDGQIVGTLGDIGVFSFYPTKNLPAVGDAGAVVTNNSEFHRKISQFCNYGSTSDDKYDHKGPGVNSRLDPIQASVLSINLRYLNSWNRKRNEIAAIYHSQINNPLVEMPHKFIENHVYHHFILKSLARDELREHLMHLSIGTEIHYPNLASAEWQRFNGLPKSKFESAEAFADSTLSLPLYPWLNFKDVDKIIESVNNFRTKKSQLSK